MPQAEDKTPSPRERCEALRKAIGDSVGVSQGLWLSYLAVLVFLLVTVGSVTHHDLFLGRPVKLPFLGVELPVRYFFWFGPLVFLLLHAYVLLHFVLLIAQVREFHRLLEGEDELREEQQRLLPSNIFVQVLIGSDDVRMGMVRFLSAAVAVFSLVVGPVFLLMVFLLWFLPYHDEWVSWSQRGMVVIDLLVLWQLSRAALRGAPARPGVPRNLVPAGAVAFAAMLLFFVVTTFPGEWRDTTLPAPQLRRALIAGRFDEVTQQQRNLLSDRLVAIGVSAVDHGRLDTAAKLAAAPVTASFRARRLEGAVFIEASLPRVDLSSAALTGAVLTRARLQGAWLDRANLTGAQLDWAQLQGASFFDAQLQGASLKGAQLQGAALVGANLRGADLSDALLQGASLVGADLRGANLGSADLRGADLSGALLHGASLVRAKLRGAFLAEASLWRTNFRGADAGWLGLRAGAVEDPKAPACKPSRDRPCRPPDMPDALRWTVERYVPEGSARTETLARLDQSFVTAWPPHREGWEGSWDYLSSSLSQGDDGESWVDLWH